MDKKPRNYKRSKEKYDAKCFKCAKTSALSYEKKNNHIKTLIVGRLKKKGMQWKTTNPTIPLNILLTDKEEKGTKRAHIKKLF